MGRGGQQVFHCFEGGGAEKVLDPQFSHFVATPLPVINDRSLITAPVRRSRTKRAATTVSTLTSAQKEALLQLHNDFRRVVVPSATNMNKLVGYTTLKLYYTMHLNDTLTISRFFK